MPLKDLRWKQALATTLAILFGIVAGVDIVGTPLAIVAIKHAESASNQAQHAVSVANASTIRTREQDCESAEKLRALGRKRIVAKRHELGKNLRLLHIPATPDIIKSADTTEQQELALVAPVNCYAYGHEAQP